MQACLKLHHSLIQGRRINVELTAGGGGKSESRQEKIKTRNERVGGQRERRAEREKEAEAAEGAPGGDADAGPRRQRGSKRKHDDDASAGADGSSRPSAGAAERHVEVVRADGEVTNPDGSVVKIRGGRRVKAKLVSQSSDIGVEGFGAELTVAWTSRRPARRKAITLRRGRTSRPGRVWRSKRWRRTSAWWWGWWGRTRWGISEPGWRPRIPSKMGADRCECCVGRLDPRSARGGLQSAWQEHRHPRPLRPQCTRISFSVGTGGICTSRAVV